MDYREVQNTDFFNKCCPAFPPPQKIGYLPLENFANSSQIDNSVSTNVDYSYVNDGHIDDTQNVKYPYLPINGSVQNSLETAILTNEDYNKNNLMQDTIQELVLEQALNTHFTPNPSVDHTNASNDLGDRIKEFLFNEKDKFNKDAYQKNHFHNCMLKGNFNDRSEHSVKNTRQLIKHQKSNDLDNPAFKSKYKIDRRYEKRESFTNFINDSFDSILSKALKNVEKRKNMEDNPILNSSQYRNENRQNNRFDNLTIESINSLKNETVLKENNYCENVTRNLYESEPFWSQNTENSKFNSNNTDRERKFNKKHFNENRIDMENTLPDEIVQFFTDEKINYISKLLKQDNEYKQGIDKKDLNFLDVSSKNFIDEQSYSNTADGRYHHSDFIDESYPYTNDYSDNTAFSDSPASKQPECHNMSEYSAKIDISPIGSKKPSKFIAAIGNNQDEGKKQKSDPVNVHRYSSPEISDSNSENDCCPRLYDYSPPTFSKNNKSNLFDKSNSHSIIENNSNSLRRNYSRSPELNNFYLSGNDIGHTQNSQLSPKYGNEFSPIRDRYNQEERGSKYSQMSPIHEKRFKLFKDSIIDKFYSYSKNDIVKSPPRNHNKYPKENEESFCRSKHSILSSKYRRDIYHRKSVTDRDDIYYDRISQYSSRQGHDYSKHKICLDNSKPERQELSSIHLSRSQENEMYSYSPKRVNSSKELNKEAYRKLECLKSFTKESSGPNRILVNITKRKYSPSNFPKHIKATSSPHENGKHIKRLTNSYSVNKKNETYAHSTKSLDSLIPEKNESNIKLRQSPTMGTKPAQTINKIEINTGKRKCQQAETETKILLSHIKGTSSIIEKNEDIPQSYILLQNQDYNGFANEFLHECSSAQEKRKKTVNGKPKLSIHERLDPPLPCNNSNLVVKFEQSQKEKRFVTYDNTNLSQEGLRREEILLQNKFSSRSKFMSKFSSRSKFPIIKRTVQNYRYRKNS